MGRLSGACPNFIHPQGLVKTLVAEISASDLIAFFPMLQTGVTVEVEAGCSILELLLEQFGLDPRFIEERVTTLFLDSRAVDDIRTVKVGPGSVLALSGAMPGLVGATLRRGGFYAAMRQGLTLDTDAEVAVSSNARIRLKLFNLLLTELGPAVLSRGIILTPAQAIELGLGGVPFQTEMARGQDRAEGWMSQVAPGDGGEFKLRVLIREDDE